MIERELRQRVVYALRSLHAVSVEAGGAPGIPDVAHALGWMELKVVKAWPVRPDTPLRVPHFTAQQREWIRARCTALVQLYENRNRGQPEHLWPGMRWSGMTVLIVVGREWLLLSGVTAVLRLGSATRVQLVDNSIKHWQRGPTDAELLSAIQEA